jgi:hypothetical protein
VRSADVEKLRQQFAVSMAVVGLHNKTIRKELMVVDKLD